MNEHTDNQPEPSFPDEASTSMESSQETPVERQEKKLENKEKENQQPDASTAGNGQTITDIEAERKTGSVDDNIRTDGPYGVQEPGAEQ